MKNVLKIIILGLLFELTVVADNQQTTTKPVPIIAVDAKTKIIFFLESDQCHVSALTPEGVVLWSKNLFPYARTTPHIEKFIADGGDLHVESTGGDSGSKTAVFDGKTGKVILMDAL